jgi:GT2 family glycosyltransferase
MLPVIDLNSADCTSGSSQRTSGQKDRAGNMRLAVLMTCYNRKQKTLACLQSLVASQGIDHLELNVVLVDDGSTDGTVDAVAAAFPWVRVDRGDGSLFWCRGMHRAFDLALRDEYDFYLWLNDDTQLYPDALSRLLKEAVELRAQQGRPVILVGSTVDEASGNLTYGGVRRASWWQPLTLVKVMPGEQPQACDTMNGNIVLIPAEAAHIVGNLDPIFEHAMGDTDYGFRAVQLGVALWVAAGVHGTCGLNPVKGTFSDRTLSLPKRWRLMLGRKVLPWRSWWRMTSKHAGPLWPIYFVWPYIKLVVSGLVVRR